MSTDQTPTLADDTFVDQAIASCSLTQGRRVRHEASADYQGQFGESDAPDRCTGCGVWWTSSERLHTGDSNGIGGWEDWMYCKVCGCDMFFPVKRAPNA